MYVVFAAFVSTFNMIFIARSQSHTRIAKNVLDFSTMYCVGHELTDIAVKILGLGDVMIFGVVRWLGTQCNQIIESKLSRNRTPIGASCNPIQFITFHSQMHLTERNMTPI